VNVAATACGALALSQGSLSDVVRVPSFLRSGALVVFGGALDAFEALFSDSVMLLSKRLIEVIWNGEHA